MNSKSNKKDESEITCYNCLVKGHYVKDCKDPTQPKPANKYKKKNSKEDLKIKTDLVVAATAASTPPWESRHVMIVNEQGVWSTHADDCAARTTVKKQWNLDSAGTIHLSPYRESFNKYKVILIGQRHVTVANGYRMSVIRVGPVHLQMSMMNQGNKVLVKNVVLNVVLHTPKSKESLISRPCLTKSG